MDWIAIVGGFGAIGTMRIMRICPRLESPRAAAADIEHAVPFIPRAQLTRKMPEKLVRAPLCTALVTAGLKVIH